MRGVGKWETRWLPVLGARDFTIMFRNGLVKTGKGIKRETCTRKGRVKVK